MKKKSGVLNLQKFDQICKKLGRFLIGPSIILIVFTSCLTLPKIDSQFDYFSSISANYDIFFQVPVKNYSKQIEKALIDNEIASEQEIRLFLSKCNFLYGSYDIEANAFEIILRGKFSKTLVSILNDNFNSKWSFFYLTNRCILLTTKDDVEFSIDKYISFLNYDPEKFFGQSLVNFTEDDILFHVREFQKISNLIFSGINLSFNRATLKAQKNEKEMSSSIYFEINDENLVRIEKFLLNKAFPNSYISIDDNGILKIENIKNSEDFIIFIQNNFLKMLMEDNYEF